ISRVRSTTTANAARAARWRPTWPAPPATSSTTSSGPTGTCSEIHSSTWRSPKNESGRSNSATWRAHSLRVTSLWSTKGRLRGDDLGPQGRQRRGDLVDRGLRDVQRDQRVGQVPDDAVERGARDAESRVRGVHVAAVVELRAAERAGDERAQV